MTAALLLAVLAWGAGSAGAVLVLVGWLDHGQPLVGWSPARLLLTASVSIVISRRLRRRLPASERDLLNAPAAGALLIGGVLIVAVLVLHGAGADSVGGSDSAGYLAQARRWTRGTLAEPLTLPDLPVTQPAWAQSPLGFKPNPTATATVPIYPPGWPLLMSAALAGGDLAAVRLLPGAFVLVALIALYGVARTWQRPLAAVVSTVAFASTAPFLFQALQPMSDVPALAAWLAALAAALRPGHGWRSVAGASAAIAVAIRPNLAPLLLVVAWAATRGATRSRASLVGVLLVVAPALVAGAAYAWLQYALYGSPWQSGYGSASELFAVHYAWTNITRQAAWVVESHGWPLLVLWVVGLATLLVRRRYTPAPVAAAAVMVWLLYLVYVPFDNWTYLRFVLLPLAVVTLLVVGRVDAWLRELRPAQQYVAFALLIAAVVATNVTTARRLGVFDLHRHEARYRLAAAFTAGQAPPHAVVLAAQHSASIAAYTQLPVIRLDLLTPADAAAALDWLTRHHRPVVVVLDEDERERLRPAFADVEPLRLDWPARARVGLPTRTRVWFIGDRDRSRAGGSVPTTPVWPEQR